MPYQRPTFDQLNAQIAADISSSLAGADGLLRFGNLPVLRKALAKLEQLNFGYLDYIAQQSNPFTATGESAEAWGALVGVIRKGPAPASGSVQFPGTPGYILLAGTEVVRSDGVTFQTTATGTVSGSSLVVVTAQADVYGVTDPMGSTGNGGSGSTVALGLAVAGVQSNGITVTPFTGGADTENDTDFKNRYLERYQNPPQGGAVGDYIEWALAVEGVTRAWCVPYGMGAGTVLVFFMLDEANASENGFPQGTNGVAAAEPRGVAATGDQLRVANYILPLQPVTALVYASAPTAMPIAFTIQGVPSGSQANVASALAGVFLLEGTADGTATVSLSDLEAAVRAVSGASKAIVEIPNDNITTPVGYLPTVGTITWLT